MESLWSLPGPSRFIQAVANDLREGASAVLRFGTEVPEGLADHLEQRSRRWGYGWMTVWADDDTRPLTLIRQISGSRAAGSDLASGQQLVTDEHLQHRVLWINGLTPSNWPTWREFLLSYAHARRNAEPDVSPPTFLAPLCGPGFDETELADPMLSYREFRDVIDRDDLQVLALQSSSASSRHRTIRSLFANTVADLAQWDPTFAQRLLDGGPDAGMEPRPILRQYAEERGWTANTPEAWTSGTLDGPRNKPVVHSALLLLQGREAELKRRLWAAQAAVLMPLLEERRTELVNRHRDRFHLPFETDLGVIEHPDDLEFGPLVYYLSVHRAEGRALLPRARKLRDFRNKLAHLEPLSPREATHPTLLNPI